MTVGIETSRVVPVSEDLALDEARLQIIRGTERMFRMDKPFSSGVSLVSGEWGVLGDDNMVARPGAVPSQSTYLVFAGTDRFDAAATRQVTLIMNSNIVIKTNKFNKAGTYEVGTLLTVKDLGAGEASVTPAANGEYVVGKVSKVEDGMLTIEVFPSVTKKS